MRGARISNAPFASLATPIGFLVMAAAVYLPPHLASLPGLSLTVVGSSWAAVRLLDLAVDPVIGHAIDRTSTRIGRFRPWFIAGAPILIGGVWALFEAPPGVGATYLIAALLVFYLGLSIFMVAQSAWTATLAPGYGDRARLFGLVQLFSVAGGIAALLVPATTAALGHGAPAAVPAMGWLLIAIVPIVVAIACRRTPDTPAASDQPHGGLGDYLRLLAKPDLVRMFLAQLTLTLGPGWMAALYLFFFTAKAGFSSEQASLLLLFYFCAGLAGAPAAAWAAVRFSKHRTLLAITSGYALCILALPWLPKAELVAYAPVLVLCGMGNAGFDLLIRSMLADVADEVRLEQGRDQTSLIYALNSLANKIAQALAIGLSYPLLARIGFDPARGAANSAAALGGLQLAFLAGPTLFVLLGGLSGLGWRMTARRHADIRSALDRAAAARAVQLNPRSPQADPWLANDAPHALNATDWTSNISTDK